MPIRRDRPSASNPGELHTPDGRVLRLKLPGEPDAEPKEREPEPERSEPDDDAVDRPAST